MLFIVFFSGLILRLRRCSDIAIYYIPEFRTQVRDGRKLGNDGQPITKKGDKHPKQKAELSGAASAAWLRMQPALMGICNG